MDVLQVLFSLWTGNRCTAGLPEDIIYLLFDNWCNSGHESEVIEAMKKAIQNPTEDTIFELSSTVEANAFKAGVRSCLQMMHCLFIEE